MSVLRLPIYEDYLPSRTLVEDAEPLDRELLPEAGRGGRGKGCTLCPLGTRPGLRTPCISAEGEAGGLLVIGEGPGQDEDAIGRPFIGKAGQLLRKSVKDHWKGRVAFDNALRCFPPRGVKLTEKHVGACRGYLTQTLDEVRPKRIVTLGAMAAMSLFGRTFAPFTTRRGYAYLRGEKLGGKPIPVFFVLHPASALRNRFVRKWWDEDIRYALTAPDPPKGPWDVEATVVNSLELARYAAADLAKNRWVSFDVETIGVMWNDEFQIISVSLCGSDRDDVWVWDRAALLNEGIRQVLLDLLSNPQVRKMGQNVKYDQLAFRAAYGIHVRPIVIDTRLQRKLIEPEADGALGKMAELVGMGGLKEEAASIMKEIVRDTKAAFRVDPAKQDKYGASVREERIARLQLPAHIEALLRLGGYEIENFMYGMLPYEVLTRYNARDAVATKKLGLLHEQLIPALPELDRMWRRQVLPAASALERIEGWGVGVSRNSIRQFDLFLEQREAALAKTLAQYAPAGMNWGSTAQVGDLLFKQLRLPVVRATDSGKPSTDAETLKLLADTSGHPLPKALLDHRFVTKLRGTYSQGLYNHIRRDGRIHPNIKLDGARSGRTSCTDPNLQTIPRAQTEEGTMARNCFVAAPGYFLVETDYSQLELRVAAMLSGDQRMLEIFRSGVDYHLRTAQLISKIAWGIAPEQVTDKHRSLAKNVNFGVLYGKTAHTFSKEWGVSKAKAQRIVDAIMGQFKDLQRWCQDRENEALTTGTVWTWWDGERARHRPLWRIADQDDAAASVARNGAKNSPIQGTASDYCIASLIQCVQWIEDEGIEKWVKLILAVHDSLMFEVHGSMVNETIHTVAEIMTSHNSQGVPLVADFKVGKSWGSMKKIEPGQDFRKILLAA